MKRQRTLSGRQFLPGEAEVRDALLRAGLAAASAQRRRLDRTTFVGVTGSAGKTTTKNLIVELLGPGTTSTPGNANRISRVGRTILGTRRGDAYCVAEVAAWRPGSVAEIARLLRPEVAVVTRIGRDHHKAFRTVEAVAVEKRALVDALPADGIAVLNADDPAAIGLADGFPGRVVSFGEAPGATLRATDVRSSWPDPLAFTLHVDGRSLPVETRLHGKHTATCVLGALGVAHALGLPLEAALETVAGFEAMPGRMSAAVQGGVAFVRDDSKAPAWSFDLVIEFLREARAARKILVVGTISDYPGSSTSVYVRSARQALAVADEVAFVGPRSSHVRKLDAEFGGTLHRFETVREAAEHFRTDLRDGDLVLIKGSNRADHLLRILLARTTDVRCWRESCHRKDFCDGCRLLHKA